jgi:hypothetical protein
MPFSAPNFNLTYDQWAVGSTPLAGPPIFAGLLCQMYFNTRGLLDITPGNTTAWVPPLYLRYPRGNPTIAVGVIVQLNYLPFDYYVCRWAQIVHPNFPNEYMVSIVEQCTAAGATPR